MLHLTPLRISLNNHYSKKDTASDHRQVSTAPEFWFIYLNYENLEILL